MTDSVISVQYIHTWLANNVHPLIKSFSTVFKMYALYILHASNNTWLFYYFRRVVRIFIQDKTVRWFYITILKNGILNDYEKCSIGLTVNYRNLCNISLMSMFKAPRWF